MSLNINDGCSKLCRKIFKQNIEEKNLLENILEKIQIKYEHMKKNNIELYNKNEEYKKKIEEYIDQLNTDSKEKLYSKNLIETYTKEYEELEKTLNIDQSEELEKIKNEQSVSILELEEINNEKSVTILQIEEINTVLENKIKIYEDNYEDNKKLLKNIEKYKEELELINRKYQKLKRVIIKNRK